MPLLDMFGREIERGDQVVLLNQSTDPYEIVDAGEIAQANGIRVVKMRSQVMLPVSPETNVFPCMIVKKHDRKDPQPSGLITQ